MEFSAKRFDPLILIAVVSLLGFGVIMVYSASAAVALERFGDAHFFLKRHLLWSAMGFAAMFLFLAIDLEVLRRAAPFAIFFSFIAIVVVLIPAFGNEVGGARRWLDLKIIQFQPSELAKFGMVLFFANFLEKKKEVLGDFTYGYLPNLIVLSVFFFLLLMEPDLGTAFLVMVVFIIMFLAAGIRISHIFLSSIFFAPFLFFSISGSEYRVKRIMTFFDPWADASGSGFQVVQSIIALGTGGALGQGLGQGRQKLFYLPEPHTDFVFAVLGEELGFFGAAAVIALFGVVVWRGGIVASRAQDGFWALLALGITSMIALQAIIHIGVAAGVMPAKGITLPFISFGGSSLVSSMSAVGVLLNISAASTLSRRKSSVVLRVDFSRETGRRRQ